MHESIRLTIVTRDKAKALHRIEEFNGTGRTLTSQLTLWCRIPLLNGDYVADDFELTGRNFAAAIDELELQLLTFGQAFQTSTLNRTDVDEHVLTTAILLDEAKTLCCVEELDRSGAFANHLSRHAAATRAAAKAATITTAKTTTGRTTETTPITATETVAAAKAAAITTAGKWIEIVFSETVPLVAPASAAPSIKTHKPDQTFDSPH